MYSRILEFNRKRAVQSFTHFI